MSMLRSSPKEIVATLGWIEKPPRTNESQLIRLLQRLQQNGSSSLYTCYNVGLCSHTQFAFVVINCNFVVMFRKLPSGIMFHLCCQFGILFLVSTCFSTLKISHSKDVIDRLDWSKVDITKSKFALLKAIKINHPDLPEACDIWLHPPAALDMEVTVTLEDEDEILGFRVQEAQS